MPPPRRRPRLGSVSSSHSRGPWLMEPGSRSWLMLLLHAVTLLPPHLAPGQGKENETPNTHRAARPCGDSDSVWFAVGEGIKGEVTALYIKSKVDMHARTCTLVSCLVPLASCLLPLPRISVLQVTSAFVIGKHQHASRHHFCCGLGLQHLCAFVNHRPTVILTNERRWPNSLHHGKFVPGN